MGILQHEITKGKVVEMAWSKKQTARGNSTKQMALLTA